MRNLHQQDGPSCVAFEEVSSIVMLPLGSGKGCCLFGHGDSLGTDLGEADADGCSSAWGVLVSGADGVDEGDCPNKLW